MNKINIGYPTPQGDVEYWVGEGDWVQDDLTGVDTRIRKIEWGGGGLLPGVWLTYDSYLGGGRHPWEISPPFGNHKKLFVWQWPDWIPEKRALFGSYSLFYSVRTDLVCKECGEPTRWLSDFWNVPFCTPLCVIAFEQGREVSSKSVSASRCESWSDAASKPLL